jgi:transposase
VTRKLARGRLVGFFSELPRCVVAMEACPSAHHWGRQLLTLGFEVRLIPPAHVKPYVRRNKNDAVDAAAICEAAGRPGQRFVPVRSIDNQAELMRHRARELLAGQRTAALNALRGHLAEIGVIAPQGAQHAYDLKQLVVDGLDEYGEVVVPNCVRAALRSLVSQTDALDEAIGAIDKEIAMSVKADETAKRLMTIPGVGPVTASAIMATIQDIGDFASGREFAAFLGLTPRQSSTGGRSRLGRITKMGDRYLRKLLVVGACATLRHRKGHNDALRLWASGMLERKTVKYKFKLTAVALANKVARIVFVLMTRGGQYDDRPVAASRPRRVRQEELSPQGEAGNRGRQRSDVNQRQRLGSPTRRRRHYERAGMMGAKSQADESSGPAEPFHPHQRAEDMTAPETFAVPPKRPLTRGAVQTWRLVFDAAFCHEA